MIRGVWHSITYNGEVADVESFIDERGFSVLLDRKDWWMFNGHPVYRGQHIQGRSDVRVEGMVQEMRDLVLDTNAAPNARHIEVHLDALR